MFRKSVSIDLMEPVICLRGSLQDEQTINILRGAISLELSHVAIVHSVTIKFVGTSKTLWPEASSHQQQWDKHILVDTVIPVISKNPLLLKKGTHSFPFEILLSNALSESIECGLGQIRYKLLCQVHVEPNSSSSRRYYLLFRHFNKLISSILSNSILQTQRPIILIRVPPLLSSHQQHCITQTHMMNDDEQEGGGQLTLHIEKAHLIPGTYLPIIFYFNQACMVHAVDQVDVKLVERQKYKAPSKQTTRILHHEMSLPPVTTASDTHLLNNCNEVRLVFAVPDKHTFNMRPTTSSHPHIKIRHWIQINIKLLLKDGTTKDLHMDASIAVLLSSLDDYINLPVYQQSPLAVLDVHPVSKSCSCNSSNRASSTPMNSTDTTTTTTINNISVSHALSSTSIASSLTCSIRNPSTSWLKKIYQVKNISIIRHQHHINNNNHRYSNLMMLMTAPPPLYQDLI